MIMLWTEWQLRLKECELMLRQLGELEQCRLMAPLGHWWSYKNTHRLSKLHNLPRWSLSCRRANLDIGGMTMLPLIALSV